MTPPELRAALVRLLEGGSAHAPLAEAVADLPPELRGRPAPARSGDGFDHTIWELLEHIRIAEEDILRYARDPSWESPSWPDGYWPGARPERIDDAAWDGTLAGLEDVRAELVAVARDEQVDLTAAIPHTDGHTWLRQILLASDHAAYHLGQVMAVRRALGA